MEYDKQEKGLLFMFEMSEEIQSGTVRIYNWNAS